MHPPLPVGYKLLDENLLTIYKLKAGDKINYKFDDGKPEHGWTTVAGWAGYDYAKLIQRDNIILLYIAIKGKTPPRFKTKKKYPWGY